MIRPDDFFRDRFRTSDTPLSGSVFYRLTVPATLWFAAQVADALLAMTKRDNWEQTGTVTIDEATQAASEVFMSFQTMVGTIFPVAWQSIPDGFLPCDGATYNRTDFPALYDVLPETFIIDDSTFRVPDLGGRVIVGVGGSFSEGDNGGEQTHQLTTDELPAHSHSTGNSATGLAVAPGELPVLTPNPIPASTGNTGGNSPHNNMQPYLVLRYVIASR